MITSSNSSKTNQEGFRTYQGYTDRVALEVQELARIISHASIQQLKLKRQHSRQESQKSNERSELSGKLGLFLDENGNFVDQRLNPNSPEFNAAYWIQNAHKQYLPTLTTLNLLLLVLL